MNEAYERQEGYNYSSARFYHNTTNDFQMLKLFPENQAWCMNPLIGDKAGTFLVLLYIRIGRNIIPAMVKTPNISLTAIPTW